MKVILNPIKQFWEWMLETIRSWFRKRQPVFRFLEVEEVPEKMNDSIVYLVGEKGHIWFAAMKCPGGCNTVIELNLVRTSRPCWTIEKHPDRTLTIHPSILRIRGCHCHFWLRNGQITWCSSPEVPGTASHRR